MLKFSVRVWRTWFFAVAIAGLFPALVIAGSTSAPGKSVKTAAQYHKEGLDYYNAGKYQAAVDVWLKEFDLEPMNANTANNIGMTYRKLKDYDAALRYHKRAVELNPNFGHGHYSLGLLYLETGPRGLARESFLRSIDLGYKVSDSFGNLMLTYGENDLAEAEKEALKIVEKQPGNAQSYLFLAAVYSLKGDNAAAAAAVKKAKKIEPGLIVPEALAYSLREADKEWAKSLASWLFCIIGIGFPSGLLVVFRKRQDLLRPNRVKVFLLALFLLLFPSPVILLVIFGLLPAIFSLAMSLQIAMEMVDNFEYFGISFAALHYAVVVVLNYFIVCILYKTARNKYALWAIPVVLLAVAMLPVYPLADVGGGSHNANFTNVVKNVWTAFNTHRP